MIRGLDPAADLHAVRDLYARAADYLELESGRAPDLAVARDYFTDAPPGGDPAT